LYEALSGVRPLEGDNAAQLVMRLLNSGIKTCRWTFKRRADVHEFFRGWESVGLRDFKQVIDSQLTLGASLTYLVRSDALALSTSLEVQNLRVDPRLRAVVHPVAARQKPTLPHGSGRLETFVSSTRVGA
jgi:hypothetical protein